MRITIILLTLLGALALVLSGVLAVQERNFQKASVAARGVVTALNEGPYHAEVEVAGSGGLKFTYTDNSSTAPLAVGETLSVRYLPSAPAETARIDRRTSGLAESVAAIGLGLIVAAWLSPLLVARFPGVFAFAIRR